MTDKTDAWLELERLASLTAGWCELVGDAALADQYAALAERYRTKASRAMIEQARETWPQPR